MKRFVVPILALIAFAAPAIAGHWVTKEIKWRISSVGAPWSATAIYVRDTTYNALGGGASDVGDTTADFTLDNAQIPLRGMAGAAATGAGGITDITGTGAGGVYQPDTTTVGWILIQEDTSAVAAPTASSLTMIIDGKAGAFGPAATLGRGWAKADSVVITQAAGGGFGVVGAETYGIPIRSISPYGNIFRWPILRARISPATGSVPGARVFLRYWTDNDFEGGNR